jgi:hypothetical protein
LVPQLSSDNLADDLHPKAKKDHDHAVHPARDMARSASEMAQNRRGDEEPIA